MNLEEEKRWVQKMITIAEEQYEQGEISKEEFDRMLSYKRALDAEEEEESN